MNRKKSVQKCSNRPDLHEEDMDLESGTGSGTGSACSSEPGSLCDDGRHRRQSSASTDSVGDTESITSSRDSLIESSLSPSQVLICFTFHGDYTVFVAD